MTSLAAVLPDTTPDFDAIKKKQQLTWASGNYAKVGSTLQLSGELLCEAMDLRSGATVLDVAAGNGNATLAAARRHCNVTSTDYVRELLDQSAERAQADGFPIQYQVADAENLPFMDGQFDNVMSTFGVMFTPNQAQSASEMLRVCRAGGKIGLANWTPDGFIGQLFKLIGKYVTPPAGLSSPALWGTEAFIHTHFGHGADAIEIEQREFCFRYLSPEHWLDVFRTYYGPTHKAFGALPEAEQALLAADILELINSHNVATDGTMKLPSTYLQIVITKTAI
ncbi:class I SAM-dependent methyltransferase [Neptuniibacter sp. CAU 1671]|uniref:class I SAM-dependent methyltransferase n=1 Tax=Neptuniibacter sp. CAU 1671 TaxID=3032593 RepID=UPI0023DB8BAB|nr:class I SAM-dependent methyltransferase [Neptuniibacter sp. CAU 1671]MDF2182724.1 class I SAM-dependent methyltransferase [Neptuniibacter sp. CAU 1671]